MVAIPVFPSRVHRHSAIYVRRDRGIKTAKDLEGRAGRHPGMGADRRHLCARLSGRGLRRRSRKVRWLQAGVNQPGRAEKVELKLPAGIHYEAGRNQPLRHAGERRDRCGDLGPRAGSFARRAARWCGCFRTIAPRRSAISSKTGIFPIMHLMTIRRAVFEQHPWVAMNLIKMFEEAKRRCYERLRDFTCARIPLPWAAAMVDEITTAYGTTPFPTASRSSRPTIEAFLPLQPRPGRDAPADDDRRSLPARGARDGAGERIRVTAPSVVVAGLVLGPPRLASTTL